MKCRTHIFNFSFGDAVVCGKAFPILFHGQ